MTGEWGPDLSAAAAYQEVTLAELRGLFDQLDFDLRDLLERELGIEGEVTDLTAELDALRRELEASGLVVSPQTLPSAQLRRCRTRRGSRARRATRSRSSPPWTTSA